MKLKELQSLLDSGVLTQAEFDAQKQLILEASQSQMQSPQTPMQPMMQPGMVQPGMVQPNMVPEIWSGRLAPPKEHASNWWRMYTPNGGNSLLGQDGKFMRGQGPNDCGNCLFGFFCVPCAHGEVVEWAQGQGGLGACIGAFICYPFHSCILSEGRKASEHAIHGYHAARGGARISLTFLSPIPRLVSARCTPLVSLTSQLCRPPPSPMRPRRLQGAPHAPPRPSAQRCLRLSLLHQHLPSPSHTSRRRVGVRRELLHDEEVQGMAPAPGQSAGGCYAADTASRGGARGPRHQCPTALLGRLDHLR